MIFAIDGPAASGKGTLGKRLAHHYGYRHLDTGVIYRAVAKMLLDQGFELTDEARAVAAAMALDPHKFGDLELKSHPLHPVVGNVEVLVQAAVDQPADDEPEGALCNHPIRRANIPIGKIGS